MTFTLSAEISNKMHQLFSGVKFRIFTSSSVAYVILSVRTPQFISTEFTRNILKHNFGEIIIQSVNLTIRCNQSQTAIIFNIFVKSKYNEITPLQYPYKSLAQVKVEHF